MLHQQIIYKKDIIKAHIIILYCTICIFKASVCVSVCLSVCLFTFEVPFKRLFAPTSRSRMSKILGDSESLGKSNGKKWSQI